MRTEGRSWRSVGAALDVPVSTVRRVLPSFPVFRLAGQCKVVSGGLLPLNAIREKFRELCRRATRSRNIRPELMADDERERSRTLSRTFTKRRAETMRRSWAARQGGAAPRRALAVARAYIGPIDSAMSLRACIRERLCVRLFVFVVS
jgi:hypothetical protein